MLWSNWLSRSRKTGDNFYSNANSFEWIKFMNEMGCVLQHMRAYISVCASVCFVSHILSLFTWDVFIRYDHCLVVLGFVLCSCFYFLAGRDRSSIMTSLLFFTFFCLLRTLPICYWWFGSFFSAICSRLVVTLACMYICCFFFHYFRALIEFDIGFNWCINMLDTIQTCTNRWYNGTLDTQE